ncbi:hypothetical protein SAMN02745218_00720 [Desulfofundulus australicus DSM 11792]|jgi:hypothetical protein|uniref:Nucleoside 2-deoxyribosyltransferase n=1 Tax=Desulfofundulus australicus DSM 11792 TaxID=1121425 RepID=A0A1M4VQW9_9FIRM|nr:hypothetical protein [Desulfofundulus australicus]SHE70893.1 hypothetical protein SAMN02745218_00707 [Desulfofundulus australicus DSM 11792]SHE71501.1 hypothetical protein SAMN02745218_00720 [Desulfofundulus australicus DSM 11792]
MLIADAYKSIVYPLDLRKYLLAGEFEQDQRMCLVFSPFNNDSDKVLMDAIEPAARECGLWVYRIDNRKMGGDIINDILRALFVAGQVIVDVTGYNPNVMYELGLTHCFKRIHEVILIWRQGEEIRLPFDIASKRAFVYEMRPESLLDLKNTLVECFKEIQEMRSRVLK